MITGVFETHLKVKDLERSMRFYGETLELELGEYEEGRRVAFYWVGGDQKHGMLGVWEERGPIPSQHFAFSVSVEDMLSKAVPYLKERHLQPKNFLDDGTERPMVFGWMPAISIYFDDPDGHELEFIAMLPGKPRPEAGIVSWEAWQELTVHDVLTANAPAPHLKSSPSASSSHGNS